MLARTRQIAEEAQNVETLVLVDQTKQRKLQTAVVVVAAGEVSKLPEKKMAAADSEELFAPLEKKWAANFAVVTTTEAADQKPQKKKEAAAAAAAAAAGAAAVAEVDLQEPQHLAIQAG